MRSLGAVKAWQITERPAGRGCAVVGLPIEHRGHPEHQPAVTDRAELSDRSAQRSSPRPRRAPPPRLHASTSMHRPEPARCRRRTGMCSSRPSPGKTRCQLSKQEVGCESEFADAPGGSMATTRTGSGSPPTARSNGCWAISATFRWSPSTTAHTVRWAGPSMRVRTARASAMTEPGTG